MYTREEISEITGFDSGEMFNNADHVRAYFQRESLAECIDAASGLREELPKQSALDDMAESVIDGGWHITTTVLMLGMED